MAESTKKCRASGAQIRAARELLDLNQRELAAAASVDINTLGALERGKRPVFESSAEKVQEALERRGIEFLNGGKPGVRLHPDRAVIPS